MKKFLKELSSQSIATPGPLPEELPPEHAYLGRAQRVGSVVVTIQRLIAHGGFSMVFAATDNAGRPYALKRMLAESRDRPLLQAEIDILMRLAGNKNIVQYIDSSFEPVRGAMVEAYLLTEYCPGGMVLDVMKSRQRTGLDEGYILRCFSSVCEAVAAMHACHPPIFHRDLKVENILIGAQGEFKLCDFGSASTKVLYPGQPGQDRGEIEEEIQKRTTLQYRSPEMCDLFLNMPIDEKSDIWALGCMLYKLCFYDTPFGDSALAIINCNYTIPASSRYPPYMHKLIRCMLQHDPAKRPDVFAVCHAVCTMLGVDYPLQKANAEPGLSILDAPLETGTVYHMQNRPPDRKDPSKAPAIGAAASTNQQLAHPIGQGTAGWDSTYRPADSVSGEASTGSRRRERPRPKATKPNTADTIDLSAAAAAFSSSSVFNGDPFAVQSTAGSLSKNDPFDPFGNMDDFASTTAKLNHMSLNDTSQPIDPTLMKRSQSGDVVSHSSTTTVLAGQQPRPYYTPQTVPRNVRTKPPMTPLTQYSATNFTL